MAIKNGRTSYNDLKEKYEKVCIRHSLNVDGTARTLCLLASMGEVFVGISKFSNRTFSFSKKKGRATAQGRAELAHSVFLGTSLPRISKEKRREELSYTIKATKDHSVQDILDDFLGTNES